jgi:hypothetical protein
MPEEKKKKAGGKKEVKGKNFVVLIPFVVVVAIVFAIGVGVKSYEASKKTASGNDIIPEKQKVVDLEQMQQKLGSEWKMIKMVRGEWHGPFKIKNGSGWRIGRGEIWVKIDNKPPFRDAPGKHHSVGGSQIMFSSATDEAIIFFKS